MNEVMVDNSCSPKDILCLQYVGIKPSRIMTSGLDIVHPKENAPLQQRILENGGLILSEQPWGVKANPQGSSPATDCRRRYQVLLSWQNVHRKAAVSIPCALHANITRDVSRSHILNTPALMRVMNY